MMKTKILFLFAAVLLFACNGNEKKPKKINNDEEILIESITFHYGCYHADSTVHELLLVVTKDTVLYDITHPGNDTLIVKSNDFSFSNEESELFIKSENSASPIHYKEVEKDEDFNYSFLFERMDLSKSLIAEVIKLDSIFKDYQPIEDSLKNYTGDYESEELTSLVDVLSLLGQNYNQVLENILNRYVMDSVELSELIRREKQIWDFDGYKILSIWKASPWVWNDGDNKTYLISNSENQSRVYECHEKTDNIIDSYQVINLENRKEILCTSETIASAYNGRQSNLSLSILSLEGNKVKRQHLKSVCGKFQDKAIDLIDSYGIEDYASYDFSYHVDIKGTLLTQRALLDVLNVKSVDSTLGLHNNDTVFFFQEIFELNKTGFTSTSKRTVYRTDILEKLK